MEGLLRNRVLRALPLDDLKALLPTCRREQLHVGQVIEPRDTPAEVVVFPTRGVASVVAWGEKGKKLETGPIGREGMTGLPIIFGVRQSPTETIVKMDGDALIAPASEVEKLMASSPATRAVFSRYAYAFSLQVVETALAASLAPIERRLARWILMLHDRIDADEMQVTHDFIAMMLGVRRPGVTVALHVLEGRHFIKADRGRIVVTNRDGLEAFCGTIYGVPEREYDRVLGPLERTAVAPKTPAAA